jgi:AbrB family looped-hinge helix DNA binding protein
VSTSTITSKGQITLPKAVREVLGVQPGDRVRFVQHADGRVTVEPLNVDLRSLRGMLSDAVRPPGRRLSITQMNEAIGRGAVEGAALGRPKSRRATTG